MTTKLNLGLMLVAFVVFLSCSKSVIEIDTLQSNVWQTNIETSLGRSLKPTKSAGSADIELVGYEYYGEVPQTSDYSRIINRIFSSDTYVVLQSNAGGNELIYDKVRNCADYGDWAVERLNFFKQEATKALAEGTGLVELEWRIDGKKEVTLAIVHDSKGVLFDNICSFVVDESVDASENNDDIDPIVELNSLQTRSEALDKVRRFRKFNSSTALWGGIEYWYYCIICETRFNSDGSIRNTYLDTDVNYSYGWHCDAAIQTTGMNGQHTFSWAYGYGQGYISIQWTGSSYRVMIPSGGYQETGADRHRFDD